MYVLLSGVSSALRLFCNHLITVTSFFLFFGQFRFSILITKPVLALRQLLHREIWILQEILPESAPVLTLDLLDFCQLIPHHFHLFAMFEGLVFAGVEHEMEVVVLETPVCELETPFFEL